ncbi:MAG: RsmD family RNA methyltransferase [Merdibacter sp.]
MRIVAGEFRSRTIDAVAGSATRPTADKIKEAVFSRIGPYFEGGRMLDAYAGSGNISFEALSRGMRELVATSARAARPSATTRPSWRGGCHTTAAMCSPCSTPLRRRISAST